MAQQRQHRQDQRSGPSFGGPGATPVADSGGPSVEPQERVCDLLRVTRERYGESLPAVAQALRIRLAYLQAIEDGRYQDLPGPTYAVGFLRTYADFLGLDGRDIVRRFKAEVNGIEKKPRLVFPAPMPEGKVPGGAVVLVSALMVALAYGVWFYLSDPEQQVADLVPPVPEHLQALIGTKTETGQPSPDGQPAKPNLSAVAQGSVSSEQQGLSPAPVEPVEVVTLNDSGTADQTGQSGAEQTLVDVALPSSLINSVTPVQVAEVNQDVGDLPARADASLRATMARPTARPEFGTGSSSRSDPSSAEAAEGDQTATGSAAAADEGVTLTQVVEAQPEATAEAAQTAAEAPARVDDTPATESPAAEVPAQGGSPDAPLVVAATADSIPAAPAMVQLSSLGAARTPQVYGGDNEDARIVLRAALDSWVQVRDSDNSLLLTRVLREGDSYRVPNRPGLVLLTGNAGGLEMVVDGVTLSPIGPVGSVRRDIPLDPDQLVSGATETR